MRRIIEKRAFLPIKWWINYQVRVRNTEMRAVAELLEKRQELEEEMHECKRKNKHKELERITGFIQAIDWICQEQKKYKQ